MTPSEVVEKQVIAFNGKDLPAFLTLFSDDICVYDMPHAKPKFVGKAAFSEAYAKPFANGGLQAEILSRMVVGNKVVDHERVHGLLPEPYDVVSVYEVHQGQIRTMWFFKSNDVSSPPSGA